MLFLQLKFLVFFRFLTLSTSIVRIFEGTFCRVVQIYDQTGRFDEADVSFPVCYLVKYRFQLYYTNYGFVNEILSAPFISHENMFLNHFL